MPVCVAIRLVLLLALVSARGRRWSTPRSRATVGHLDGVVAVGQVAETIRKFLAE